MDSDLKENNNPLPNDAIDIDPHAGEVDITLLWYMLSKTPAERLDYADNMRRSMLELRRAGRKHYGITGFDELDPESSPPTDGSGS